MKVIATKPGYFGKLRAEGDVFDVPEGTKASWFVLYEPKEGDEVTVDPKAAKEAKAAQAKAAKEAKAAEAKAAKEAATNGKTVGQGNENGLV